MVEYKSTIKIKSTHMTLTKREAEKIKHKMFNSFIGRFLKPGSFKEMNIKYYPYFLLKFWSNVWKKRFLEKDIDGKIMIIVNAINGKKAVMEIIPNFVEELEVRRQSVLSVKIDLKKTIEDVKNWLDNRVLPARLRRVGVTSTFKDAEVIYRPVLVMYYYRKGELIEYPLKSADSHKTWEYP